MPRCPNCGRDNESHYKFCVACGADLKPDSDSGRLPHLPSTGAGAAFGAFAAGNFNLTPASPFGLSKSAPPNGSDAAGGSDGLAEFSIDDESESEHGDMLGTDAVGSLQVYSNRPQLAEPELVALPDEDMDFDAPPPKTGGTYPSMRARRTSDDFMPPPKPFSSRPLSARTGSAISEALAAEASVSMRFAPLNEEKAEHANAENMSSGTYESTVLIPPKPENYGRAPLRTSFVQDDARVSPFDAPETLQSVSVVERKCAKCGTVLPPNFIFCGRCGARYEEPVSVRPKAMLPGPVAYLTMIHPDGTEGECVELGQELEIGRSCGIKLFENDPFLSPHHARFLFERSKLRVFDLGSLNGLFLRLRGEVELAHGDMFRIGQQLLRFEEIERMPRCVEAVDHATVLGAPLPSGAWGRLSSVAAIDVTGQALLLSKPEVHCGRDRGDIRFPEDGFVSGSHCKLSFRGGRCYLQDLGSTNGTYLRIREQGLLVKGDLLLIGQQLFKVKISEEK